MAAVTAQGHRLNQALTTVVWNSAAQTLEVSHRLHLHDAATALSGDANFDNLEDRARVALYAAKHLFLFLEDEQTCELQVIGAEIEGLSIYVYQECTLISPPRKLGLLPAFLFENISGQVNHVNVELGQQVRSLSFARGDTVKWLVLGNHKVD